MEPKEPICAFNLRKFPKALRKELRQFSIREEEDVQDIVPRWLRERLEVEKGKPQGKKNAKPK